ncbi:MAG: hypothetical protein V1911_01165, partial [Candidatus Micrarchaeota archaeon]
TPNPAVRCLEGTCMYGEKDVLAEYKNLTGNVTGVVILGKGKPGAQKTQYVNQAVAQLSSDYGYKGYTVAMVELDENDQPTKCICEQKLSDLTFANCADNSTSACLAMQPTEGQVMFYIEYPEYQNNRIMVQGRTVRIEAKTGTDLLAIINMLKSIEY